MKPEFNHQPEEVRQIGRVDVHIFETGIAHRDERTIASFEQEWEKFDVFTDEEIERIGGEYFDIVPDGHLGPEMLAIDLGCGSGRWTKYLSKRVGHVEAADPSGAIFVAAHNHADLANVRWSQAGVEELPFADDTFDFALCLGVLHHVPDTSGALEKLVRKVRPGGSVLLYLYYAFDGRGPLFRTLHKLSESLRRVISSMPRTAKRVVCELIAWTVYVPLRALAITLKKLGVKGWQKLPLSYYHNKSITVVRNDALDRFGTPLEQRFTKEQIREMMENAGLTDIRFSAAAPFWHALGWKK